MKGLCIIKS